MKENPGDPFVHVNLFKERAMARRKVEFPFPHPTIHPAVDKDRKHYQN